MSPVLLYFGDCLEEMRQIPDGSVDLILDDLPYATTNSKSEAGQWDNLIPFEPMWEQFLRVTKEDAAIILFAQGMFTARLMLSQPKLYRYSLVWDKCRSTGFLNASKMPLRRHEDILVFYRKQPTYNPQLVLCAPSERTHSRGNLKNRQTNRVYGEYKDVPAKDPYHKKPPEEDAESLVRHRNRATPLDKTPQKMLKYAPENKAYYEPTLIVT